MSEQTHEREALEEGLGTEFWRLFSDYVTREWGPAGLRYQQAVREAAQSANAVIELQKVLAQQDAILHVMRWPAERLGQLKQIVRVAEPTASRRGPGL